MVFNGGEIAPQGRFFDLPDLWGNLSFQEGDFAKLE